MAVKNSELDIRIVRISEVQGKSHVNRWEMLRYGNSPTDISVDLTANVGEDMALDQITLRLEVIYTYMRSMVRRPLLKSAVEAVFEIPGLDRHVAFSPSRETLEIPPSLMTLMLGVAIGALRGMVAQKTVGTPIADRPLPLVNISWLVSRLMYGNTPSRRTIPLEAQVCV